MLKSLPKKQLANRRTKAPHRTTAELARHARMCYWGPGAKDRAKRMARAKRILISQPQIEIREVARRVGFNTHSALTKAMKRETGMTPEEFRFKNVKC